MIHRTHAEGCMKHPTSFHRHMQVDVELDFFMTPTLTNPKLDLGMTHRNFVAFKRLFRSISTAP